MILKGLRKQILQLIVNYDVMWHRKKVKFVEVGKSGIGFCLSQQSFSPVQKCNLKNYVWLWRHRDVVVPSSTLLIQQLLFAVQEHSYDTHPSRWSITPSLMLERLAVSEELR